METMKENQNLSKHTVQLTNHGMPSNNDTVLHFLNDVLYK